MIHNLFTIHDVKAMAFLPPFILPRSEMAVRTFSDCINSKDHQFGAHPEDYTLFRLGRFDDETAKYILEDAPYSIGNGLEFVNPETPDSANGTQTSEKAAITKPKPLRESATGNNSAE